jgi:nitric oxide dioxygenase
MYIKYIFKAKFCREDLSLRRNISLLTECHAQSRWQFYRRKDQVVLDTQTQAVITSTVPVLQEYGQAITTRFYQRMFNHHPELLNIFNHSNQREGLQQQALAASIYAAAANIANLEAILPIVKRIGYKHCSLGVQPEHYPIVGKHLLLAIQDVLGDAVTPQIISAWGKAYAEVADYFIRVEQEIYQETANKIGGWAGFRPFLVKRKVQEAEDIVSLYLEAADGKAIASYKPGQYISVKIHSGDYDHLRQYSLTDAPSKGYYRIALKLEDRGIGKAGIVSTFLHQQINEGDTLEISAPVGDFVLESVGKSPLVLLAGGVGITPLLSMLHSVSESIPHRPVILAYAIRSGRYHAFAEEIKQLAARDKSISSMIFYEKPDREDIQARRYDYAGYIDAEWLRTHVTQDADIYVCGPRPFMQFMISLLLAQGCTLDHIHYEVFGPSLSFAVS